MKPLEYARGMAFWFTDRALGGKVRTSLRTMRHVEAMVEDEIWQYQKGLLEALLDHARRTVPHWSNQRTLNIEEWPITYKMTYRNNYDGLLSNEYNRSELVQMTTSGSTGTPFISYQDPDKKKHVNAETLYYNGEVGYKIGRRIIYLRSVVSEVQKTCFQQFCQNIYLVDCNDLSDEGIRNKLKKIVKLSTSGGAMLMGYASTFDAFRLFFEKHGYDEVAEARIYGVVSGSEMLHDNTRESMQRAFGCKCVSRYANEENGFLAQDRDESNVFYLDRAHYYFEILNLDDDTHAAEGEVGRIVVTDLFNYAMPMIRYDTGDIGAIRHLEYDSKSQVVLQSFGGRRVDMVTDCQGSLISPHAITNLMWRYQTIDQYQFVQHRDGSYTLKVNPPQNESVQDALMQDYREILGANAVLTVNGCTGIPVLSSGKRRYIVNETM